MAFDHTKSPFPWFGGKTNAAPTVWQALGDVDHYVEPFYGGGAVLLNRPHQPNRPYHSETVNDIYGLLVNAWRAIQHHPAEVAAAASWPVAETDLHARHIALIRWAARPDVIDRLSANPEWCDPKMAGWWIWGQCSWIGGGWCAGTGPWTERDGLLVKQDKTDHKPGVSRQLPHLSNNGQGVNHAGLREPGMKRQRPHLGNNGQGVNSPQLREPGVADDDWEPHPMVMPRLEKWIGLLAARLRHVRILNGDWKRACTSGALRTLPVRQGGICGVFLDPPYADTADRDMGIYAHDSGTVAHDVAEWCLANGHDPQYRIVLAGFEGEHGTALTDAGWREVQWFKVGFLTGGMGNVGNGNQQNRERLWLSPHCIRNDDDQLSLFDNT